jgi:hypothetical protein
MSLRNLRFATAGLVLGAFVALMAPPAALGADETCRCSDSGLGAYQCSQDHTTCIAGHESCVVCCGSIEPCGG